jgi:hypothetical protein
LLILKSTFFSPLARFSFVFILFFLKVFYLPKLYHFFEKGKSTVVKLRNSAFEKY